MKFRRVADPPAGESREEVRELAEALSLFGSAMRHLADQQSATPRIAESRIAERRPSHALRLRLLLAPAMAAAVAVAVALPVYSHLHHRHHGPTPIVAQVAQQNPAQNRASVDDTALMTQIDNEVSQDVPDALQPLAALSEQAVSSTTSASEKKHVSQE